MTSKTEVYLDECIPYGSQWADSGMHTAIGEAEDTGKILVIPPGDFKFEFPFRRQLSSNSPVFRGCGLGKSRLRFPNAAAGEVQFWVHSDKDWYDFEMSDFQISSEHDGTLVKIGKDDKLDPLNFLTMNGVGIFNGMPGAQNSVALDVGYIVNSNFSGVRANCFANGQGANYGTAFLIRQMEFTNFGSCSFGNASYGIKFIDGFSFANVFNAIDVENVNICIQNQSQNTGLNTFIGGQFSLFNNYLIDCPVGLGGTRFHFINPNKQFNSGSQAMAPGTSGVYGL